MRVMADCFISVATEINHKDYRRLGCDQIFGLNEGFDGVLGLEEYFYQILGFNECLSGALGLDKVVIDRQK